MGTPRFAHPWMIVSKPTPVAFLHGRYTRARRSNAADGRSSLDQSAGRRRSRVSTPLRTTLAE